MRDDMAGRVRPKPDGEPGSIITYDPERKSFKNAFVTIVFCGVYLESLLHLLIVKRFGTEIYEQYDRRSYEDKLRLLGCTDEVILEGCRHYRDARRDVVHEKAHMDRNNIRIAQDEAKLAMALIDKISADLTNR